MLVLKLGSVVGSLWILFELAKIYPNLTGLLAFCLVTLALKYGRE